MRPAALPEGRATHRRAAQRRRSFAMAGGHRYHRRWVVIPPSSGRPPGRGPGDRAGDRSPAAHWLPSLESQRRPRPSSVTRCQPAGGRCAHVGSLTRGLARLTRRIVLGRDVEVAADRHDHRRPRHRVVDDPARQPEHVGDQLRRDDLVRRPLGDDRPVAHRDEVVGVAAGVVEVVQDEHDRAALALVEVDEEVEHLDLVGEVEVRRRLVEQHQPGALGERHGDPHPLALAAGQLVDRAAGDVERAGRLERAVDGGPVGRASTAGTSPGAGSGRGRRGRRR